jgi:hypothetical protein
MSHLNGRVLTLHCPVGFPFQEIHDGARDDILRRYLTLYLKEN